MKLILPHREVRLKSDLSYEERNAFIYSLLDEKIEFHNETMTVNEYLRHTFNKDNSKTIMNIIAYYLTKGNAEGEDREILSHKKEKEMQRGSKRHTTFSGMSIRQQEELGLIDVGDSSYD